MLQVDIGSARACHLQQVSVGICDGTRFLPFTFLVEVVAAACSVLCSDAHISLPCVQGASAARLLSPVDHRLVATCQVLAHGGEVKIFHESSDAKQVVFFTGRLSAPVVDHSMDTYVMRNEHTHGASVSSVLPYAFSFWKNTVQPAGILAALADPVICMSGLWIPPCLCESTAALYFAANLSAACTVAACSAFVPCSSPRACKDLQLHVPRFAACLGIPTTAAQCSSRSECVHLDGATLRPINIVAAKGGTALQTGGLLDRPVSLATTDRNTSAASHLPALQLHWQPRPLQSFGQQVFRSIIMSMLPWPKVDVVAKQDIGGSAAVASSVAINAVWGPAAFSCTALAGTASTQVVPFPELCLSTEAHVELLLHTAAIDRCFLVQLPGTPVDVPAALAIYRSVARHPAHSRLSLVTFSQLEAGWNGLSIVPDAALLQGKHRTLPASRYA